MLSEVHCSLKFLYASYCELVRDHEKLVNRLTRKQSGFVKSGQYLMQLEVALSELYDSLALAPNLYFVPQLCVQHVNISNCSEEIFELEPNTQILTLS